MDETAGSLSLLSDFELGLTSGEDEVVQDRPGADDRDLDHEIVKIARFQAR